MEEVFGIPAHFLNDDRLGRARDAIAPHLDTITGSIGASAIDSFGIGTARLHWDMTSFSLFGAYEHGQQAAFPAPRPVRAKDGSIGLLQIQAGLAVSGDGGIPVFHRAYDGGASEVTQVVVAMKSWPGRRTSCWSGTPNCSATTTSPRCCRPGWTSLLRPPSGWCPRRC
ncbi:hypothetical protein WEB32_33985 [Streptomyces netropsis]|uniref:hypothetical protein n=1 Tax=Streptomyces netropsis TaxID=55404 RepID=UPI0030CCD086